MISRSSSTIDSARHRVLDRFVFELFELLVVEVVAVEAVGVGQTATEPLRLAELAGLLSLERAAPSASPCDVAATGRSPPGDDASRRCSAASANPTARPRRRSPPCSIACGPAHALPDVGADRLVEPFLVGAQVVVHRRRLAAHGTGACPRR